MGKAIITDVKDEPLSNARGERNPDPRLKATIPSEQHSAHSNYHIHEGFVFHDLEPSCAARALDRMQHNLKNPVELTLETNTTREMKPRLFLTPRRAQRADPLRSHLENWLHGLPGKLPPFDQTQLLDDLCFLLCSPLFLYAVSPRLCHAKSPWRSSGPKKPVGISIYALNMMIVRDDNGWATQLLYGGTPLIEGRQYIATGNSNFTQSFYWFCDEARFLSCEFHARDEATAEALSTVVDPEPAVVETRQTRARTAGQKQRRIVKLKIR
ncbi:hypothetical protein G6011_09409 [Alternaria panax]|uniref:Uncharacterized protein n=1 Tax=Alternaria panax TaxID=48097 RepID=A0AAD4IAX3_9PLEO|nr:hypothetical protein G6011_09409 [Alternaria panax]